MILEDHDLAAEAAVLAFGGRPFPCLDVLKRWRDLHTWAMSGQLLREMEARVGSDNPVVLPELAPRHELGLLLTWERSWRRSRYFSDHQRLLEEQLRKRALGPLRQHLGYWKQRSGARLLSSVSIDVRRPGQSPQLRGSMNRVKVTATAGLTVGWVLDVWARGLALLDQAFVLEVVPQRGPGRPLTVRAVRWREESPGNWAPVVGSARVGVDPQGVRRLAWEEGGAR